jgi:hypothetical protein
MIAKPTRAQTIADMSGSVHKDIKTLLVLRENSSFYWKQIAIARPFAHDG